VIKPYRADVVVKLVADESSAAAAKLAEEFKSDPAAADDYVETAYTGGTIEYFDGDWRPVDRMLNNERNREGKSEAYIEMADPELGACPPPPVKKVS
jgi:hypothetical protein